MFSDFFSENCAVYEIMPKNVVEPERTQTIWRMRVEYLISKQPHARTHPPTHSLSLSHTQICKTAFPRQQWFRERASVLGYTNIVCLV